MADKRDYYEVLGVDKNASADDLKKAYRQMAKKYHPDLHPGDKTAEAQFKEVNEAYEVLSDDQKRAAYDRYGHDMGAGGFGGAGGAGFGGTGGFGGFDMGDIFDSFFGGGQSRQARRGGPQPGSDLRYDMTITFQEAAFGVKKQISITRLETCEACSGSGAKKGSQVKTCPTCHGTGQVRTVQNTILGQMATSRVCDACRGEGTIISQPCETCGGQGRVRKTRKIDINIPAGIDDGQIMTLRGQGEHGKKGGAKGDLLIYITVRPHKLFTRQGNNLYCEVAVPYSKAVLGGEIEIPTLDGMQKHTLAEGTQPGAVVRLRGKGMPSVNNQNVKGDLFATISINVPKRLSLRQKELLRAYDEAMGEERKSLWERLRDTLGGK